MKCKHACEKLGKLPRATVSSNGLRSLPKLPRVPSPSVAQATPEWSSPNSPATVVGGAQILASPHALPPTVGSPTLLPGEFGPPPRRCVPHSWGATLVWPRPPGLCPPLPSFPANSIIQPLGLSHPGGYVRLSDCPLRPCWHAHWVPRGPLFPPPPFSLLMRVWCLLMGFDALQFFPSRSSGPALATTCGVERPPPSGLCTLFYVSINLGEVFLVSCLNTRQLKAMPISYASLCFFALFNSSISSIRFWIVILCSNVFIHL